jgi:hypothetical protein
LFVILKPLGKVIAIFYFFYVNTYVIEVPAPPACRVLVLYTL